MKKDSSKGNRMKPVSGFEDTVHVSCGPACLPLRFFASPGRGQHRLNRNSTDFARSFAESFAYPQKLTQRSGYFMKITIQEKERGFLFLNGRFVRMLEPGRHTTLPFRNYTVTIVELTDQPFTDERIIATYGRDKKFLDSIVRFDIADNQIALHYVDGRYNGILEKGGYAFWNIFRKHTFKLVDMTDESSVADVPLSILDTIPERVCKQVLVEDQQAVLLYIDGTFVHRLPSGRHFFWQNGRKITWVTYDMRTTQIELTGQEILTLDKVGIRVNFVCSFRITDPLKLHNELQNFQKEVYVTLQLALREMLGRMRLDEVFELKNGIADNVLEFLKGKESELFVKFLSAGIKDIIFPGEIRDIMNTVLLAEKKAQANVITRREEVASTRSLLNTARLMDENATLYKLKELEYLEKICENVSNISVNSASGLIEQLGSIMKV
jgi:regulator of protease activity HflC (stomatin/prohibitin superfamily)